MASSYTFVDAQKSQPCETKLVYGCKQHKNQIRPVCFTWEILLAPQLLLPFFILEVGGGIIEYILNYFKKSMFLLLKIIKDINPWGPLWQIIVENMSFSRVSYSSSSLSKYRPKIKHGLYSMRKLSCSTLLSFYVQGPRLRHCHWVWLYKCFMIMWNNWRNFTCLYLPYWPGLTIMMNLSLKH